jgi:hypothetical protein
MRIPTMTMQERALNYPYEAPSGDYLVKDGQCLPLPEQYDCLLAPTVHRFS